MNIRANIQWRVKTDCEAQGLAGLKIEQVIIAVGNGDGRDEDGGEHSSSARLLR